MKLRMAENSLFAVLLRSRWWISILIAGGMALAAAALLPKDYKALGAVSGFPFVVIGVMAARRQWRQPSAAQVQKTQQAIGAMPWPEFAARLQRGFERAGYSVQPGRGGNGVDFELERQGRRTLVSARRWKSARIGVEALKPLLAAREAGDAQDALYIGLGELTDQARPFAAEHRIGVWRAAELAQLLPP